MLGTQAFWARRSTRLVALGVPLIASAFVYFPIRGCFFLTDDFHNFLMVADAGAYRFILTPMGGHLLFTRNAILALFWTLFGLDPAPFFWGVLLTHLVNVWLLFRLVLRVTARPAAAAAGATLWGISPLHAEPLGWYAVFGQVLSTTAMLVVLSDAARFLAPSRWLSVRRAVVWGAILLTGATCFGTGLGVAVTVPIAVVLMVPSARRPRVLVALGVSVLAVVLAYAGSPRLMELLGESAVFQRASIKVALTNLTAVPPMLVHLIRYGLGRLLAGPFVFGIVDPVPFSWAMLGMVGALGAAVLLRPRSPLRWPALGLLLVCLGSYGVIALGRANFAEGALSGIQPAARTLRYHYAGSAALTALLGILVGAARGRWLAPLTDGFCLAAIAAVVARSIVVPLPINTHPVVRSQVASAVARADADSAHASPTTPVRLDNTRLPIVTGVFGPTSVPGIAALMVLTYPGARLEDRGVRFLEPDASLRAAFTAPRSRRLSRLLVPPQIIPGGLPPTGILPPCEFPLARELVRFQRRLVGCELRVGAGSNDAEPCRASAAAAAVARMTPPAGTRPCRACFHPEEQTVTLRKLFTAGGRSLRCLPNDAPDERVRPGPAWRCRATAGHAVAHFLADLTRCPRRAAERAQVLEDPPCIAAAEDRYLARMRQLGGECAGCQAPLVAVVAKIVTARTLESVFCVF